MGEKVIWLLKFLLWFSKTVMVWVFLTSKLMVSLEQRMVCSLLQCCAFCVCTLLGIPVPHHNIAPFLDEVTPVMTSVLWSFADETRHVLWVINDEWKHASFENFVWATKTLHDKILEGQWKFVVDEELFCLFPENEHQKTNWNKTNQMAGAVITKFRFRDQKNGIPKNDATNFTNLWK